jgi:hypothetical protein
MRGVYETGGGDASQAAHAEYVDGVAEAEAQGFRSAAWAAAMDTLDLEVFPGAWQRSYPSVSSIDPHGPLDGAVPPLSFQSALK